MKNAGLVVREDVMGNIFGRWQGSNASAGAQPPRLPRVGLMRCEGVKSIVHSESCRLWRSAWRACRA